MADATTTIQLIIEAQNRAQSTLQTLQREMLALNNAVKAGSVAQDQATKTATSMAGAFKGVLAPLSVMPGAAGAAATQVSGMAESMAAASVESGGMALATAGVVAAFVAIGVAIIGASRDVGHYQQQLDILAERTGLTTSQIGALKVAAAESGTGFETVQRSVDIFVRHLGDAQDGSAQAVAAFDRIGVSIRDSVTGEFRATGDVLFDVSKKLHDNADAADRASKAFGVFGRGSSVALRAITSDLNALAIVAQQKGIVFSPETEAQLLKVNSGFERLGTSVLGLKLSLEAMVAVRFQPVITGVADLADTITKFVNSEPFKAWMSFAKFFVSDRVVPTPTTAGRDMTSDERSTAGLSNGSWDQSQFITKDFLAQSKLGPMIDARAAGEMGMNQIIKEAAAARLKVEQEALKLPVLGPPSAPFFEAEKLGGQTPEAQRSMELSLIEFQKNANDMGGALTQLSETGILVTQTLDGQNKATLAAAEAARHAGNQFESLRFIVANSVSGIISTWLDGTKSIGDIFKNLIKSMISSIGGNIIQTIVLTGIKIAAAATGGGAIVGTPNGPGGGIGPMPQAASFRSGNTVNVTINASGHFIDRNSLQEFASEMLVPVVVDTMNRGSYRGR